MSVEIRASVWGALPSTANSGSVSKYGQCAFLKLLSGLHRGCLISPEQDRRGHVGTVHVTIEWLEISAGFGLASKGVLS